MRNKRNICECEPFYYSNQVLTRAKRRKISSRYSIEDLPNEILLKIFNYLEFKDLGYCAQISHRFREISRSPSLWETVIENNQTIPAGFILHALNLGCKYLHLENSTITVTNDSDYVMHKLPKDNQVKHLNLRNFQDHCDDSTKLMIACRSLEKLSLSSLDFNKARYIPSIERNGSTLKTLDLSDCSGLTYKQIQRIFTACHKLEEIDLSCTNYYKISKLSTQSISFVCGILPATHIKKVNLSGLPVKDCQLNLLIKRCLKITELCLCKTLITQQYWDSLSPTVKNWLQCHQLSSFGKNVPWVSKNKEGKYKIIIVSLGKKC